MNETVSTILGCVFGLFLFFIFDGEPDLWDKWHEQEMKINCEAQK